MAASTTITSTPIGSCVGGSQPGLLSKATTLHVITIFIVEFLYSPESMVEPLINLTFLVGPIASSTVVKCRDVKNTVLCNVSRCLNFEGTQLNL